MTTPKTTTSELSLLDLKPAVEDVRTAAKAGLRDRPRRLPCKLLYDAHGSQLFEEICKAPEYYPTRTEMGILRRYGEEIAERAGAGCTVIEPGSGASVKTPLLLDNLIEPAAYVPMEISKEMLIEAASRLQSRYPDLPILPVCADYTQTLRLPEEVNGARPRLAFFPGSTIGNFEWAEAVAFLQRLRGLLARGDRLLIGVDLRKDPAVLEAAYNDAAGVTAAFNLNLLHRLNRELDADFDADAFEHDAPWIEERNCIEMHLVSRRDQAVHIDGERFDLIAGERIHTESSHKYEFDDFAALARKADFYRETVWTDDDRMFSVQLLRAG